MIFGGGPACSQPATQTGARIGPVPIAPEKYQAYGFEQLTSPQLLLL